MNYLHHERHGRMKFAFVLGGVLFVLLLVGVLGFVLARQRGPVPLGQDLSQFQAEQRMRQYQLEQQRLMQENMEPEEAVQPTEAEPGPGDEGYVPVSPGNPTLYYVPVPQNTSNNNQMPASSSTSQTYHINPEVDTLSARNIDDDSAQLRGSVVRADASGVVAWFVLSDNDRTPSCQDPRIDIRVPRYRAWTAGETFKKTVSLEEDTRYWYRACIIDFTGDLDSGSVRTFSTDETSGTNNNNNNGGGSSDPDDPDPSLSNIGDVRLRNVYYRSNSCASDEYYHEVTAESTASGQFDLRLPMVKIHNNHLIHGYIYDNNVSLSSGVPRDVGQGCYDETLMVRFPDQLFKVDSQQYLDVIGTRKEVVSDTETGDDSNQ